MLAHSWSSDNECWPTDGYQITDTDPQLVNRQQMMSHSCLSDKEWCPIAGPQMRNDVTQLVIRWGMMSHSWLSDEELFHTADHQIRNDVLQLVMRWGMIYVPQLVICQWHRATDDNPIMNDNPRFAIRCWMIALAKSSDCNWRPKDKLLFAEGWQPYCSPYCSPATPLKKCTLIGDFIFSLSVQMWLGEPAVHFRNFLPFAPYRGQPVASAIPGGNPPGDWQSAVGWGDARFKPGTAGQQSGMLPLSHHASFWIISQLCRDIWRNLPLHVTQLTWSEYFNVQYCELGKVHLFAYLELIWTCQGYFLSEFIPFKCFGDSLVR